MQNGIRFSHDSGGERPYHANPLPKTQLRRVKCNFTIGSRSLD